MLVTIARNALANSAATFARLLIGFFLTPFLIHALGAETYGIWSFVSIFSISGYLTLLTLGVQGTLVRDLAGAVATRDDDRFRHLFAAALAIYAAAGAVGAALLIVVMAAVDALFSVPPGEVVAARTLFLLLAVQTLIDFPALVLDAVVEAYQRYTLRGAIESARFAAFAMFAVLLLQSGAGVVSLGAVTLGLAAAAFAVELGILRAGYPGRIRWAAPSWSVATRLLRESASLFVIRLNAVIFQQMDRTILARVLSTTAITHYDIGARIYGFAMIPQSLPASVILPTAASKLALGERSEVVRLFVSITRYTAAVAVPLALGLIVLARPFVRTWIGPAYEPDAVYAQAFLAIAVFWAFTHVGYNTMIALGRMAPLAWISVTTTLVNLAASVVLALQLGIMGVILGTAIGNAMAAALYFRLYVRSLGLSWRAFLADVVLRGAAPGLLATVVLVAAVWSREPVTLVEVGAYLGAYLALSLALYAALGADPAERDAARRVIRRVLTTASAAR